MVECPQALQCLDNFFTSSKARYGTVGVAVCPAVFSMFFGPFVHCYAFIPHLRKRNVHCVVLNVGVM